MDHFDQIRQKSAVLAWSYTDQAKKVVGKGSKLSLSRATRVTLKSKTLLFSLILQFLQKGSHFPGRNGIHGGFCNFAKMQNLQILQKLQNRQPTYPPGPRYLGGPRDPEGTADFAKNLQKFLQNWSGHGRDLDRDLAKNYT